MTMASEVWVFGSTARGDVDALSDVDILVAGPIDRATIEELAYPAEALSVVQYSWPELEHMAGYGSLFLQHVRSEGKPLRAEEPSRLRELMGPMSTYTRAESELLSFRLVLDDVELSLDADCSPAFELSVIATTLRHACILGCYAIGRPTFGRNTAFDVFLEHIGHSNTALEARSLYEFRLYEDGRAPIPFEPTSDSVRIWLSRAREVLDNVGRSLRGDD